MSSSSHSSAEYLDISLHCRRLLIIKDFIADGEDNVSNLGNPSIVKPSHAKKSPKILRCPYCEYAPGF